MPLKTVELDQTVREDDITLLIGKNIVIKLVEDDAARNLLKTSSVVKLLETDDLCDSNFLEGLTKLKELQQEVMGQASAFYYVTSNFVTNWDLHAGSQIAKYDSQKGGSRSKREVPPAPRTTLDRLSRIDKQMIGVENELRKHNSQLEVLQPTTFPYCKKCKTSVIPVTKEAEKKESEKSETAFGVTVRWFTTLGGTPIQ